ncbi:acyl-CoA dehydrogenase family protein [Variovorax sp. LjRoot178]|uniref:acyl-CoA dehydrogenase family protein n=1 Tax=Variovorax sp. LjRoot178 TaxID=3342277 RepID=UPI003ED02E92
MSELAPVLFFEQYDSELTQAERSAVAVARNFCADELADVAALAYLRNEPFDQQVISRWGELGFFGLQVETAQGGMGGSFLCKIRVAQEMARHGFAMAFCLNNMQGMATRVSRHGTPRQKEAFLANLMQGRWVGAPAMSEPQGGSDLSKLSCRATRVEGGWVINGSKAWVTNGVIVDLITLLARVPDEEGADIASFLVRVDGPTAVRSEILSSGARSFRLGRIDFRDHFVPDWALLYPPGQAFARSLESINAARVHVAAMCVASLYSAFTIALRYCGERVAFGKPLTGHQGLRWSLADVAMKMEAANSLVFRAASRVQRGQDVTMLAAQAKTLAVEVAVEGVQACMQAMGAIGASAEFPLSMHASELRMAAYADGTSEMLRDRAGKSLAKSYLDS